MAKFKEIVYMVLDLLKEAGDDSFYTEEHVLFLATKFRSLLLERKYKQSRNSAYAEIAEENRQLICLDLELANLLPDGCAGQWLKSTVKVPEMLRTGEPRVSVVNDLMHSMVTYIPPERMPYVGFNKWLRNIIYVSRSGNGFLYLRGNNPQFLNLEKIQLSAVFADPEEAEKCACECAEGDESCDIMDKEFPLEDSLIPSCIELVVQELAGPRYAPRDEVNNDRDELSRVGVAPTRAARPAEGILGPASRRQTRRQQRQEEE